MKWMIASDIHGSAYYCKELLKQYESEHAERLILLGDLLYHGPRNELPREYAPKEVIPMLNSRRDEILAVRGNCDAEVDQMVLDFPIKADYAVFALGTRSGFLTHGHLYHEKNLPPLKTGDILLHGHTHIPKCTEHGSYVYLNPGSAAIPKENSHHGYMLLEDGVFIWKAFDGRILHQYDAR